MFQNPHAYKWSKKKSLFKVSTLIIKVIEDKILKRKVETAANASAFCSQVPRFRDIKVRANTYGHLPGAQQALNQALTSVISFNAHDPMEWIS